MTSKYTGEQRAFLRRLEGADAGADSALARRMLVEDSQDVTRRRKAANALENVARGRIFGVTAPTTHINSKPTANGAAAIKRNRKP
jgi:hypothetical protein